MDESEKLTEFQELLTEAYLDYVNRHKRKVGDNEFARYLGVPAGSYSQWINGSRSPSYDNILKLSIKLGPRVFDIFGYERVAVSNNPDIMLVAEKWRFLDDETKRQIIEHINEEVSKRTRGA